MFANVLTGLCNTIDRAKQHKSNTMAWSVAIAFVLTWLFSFCSLLSCDGGACSCTL